MRAIVLLLISFSFFAQKIDRKSVVERHQVYNQELDTLASLSVGNGHFTFTVDATGLQTFPAFYAKGIPLGTQSSWSWHAFPNLENFQRSETYRTENYAGRPMAYALQGHKNARKDAATDYFRANPHRIHLGHVGFRIKLENGSLATPDDLRDIKQRLNPYTGEIQSSFSVEGFSVKVLTFSDPQEDIIYTKVESPLLKIGRLSFQLDFPFPSLQFLDEGVTNAYPEKHKSYLSESAQRHLVFQHQIDSLHYPVAIQANQLIQAQQLSAHTYEIKANHSAQIELAVGFGDIKMGDFHRKRLLGRNEWKHYWNQGGMIDFGLVKDQRAKELERRMVLSMYLAKVQSTSEEPPQETGLVYNSWFGRPHLEMTWWHLMHFAYWNKGEYLEKVLPWYERNFKEAKELALRQGLRGVRWQKMTDPDGESLPLLWDHFCFGNNLISLICYMNYRSASPPHFNTNTTIWWRKRRWQWRIYCHGIPCVTFTD